MTDQFALTEDQLAIQDMARRFTADAITPHAATLGRTVRRVPAALVTSGLVRTTSRWVARVIAT